MLQKIRKQAEGFTIIEVLIVLAIAGLILLIVFLAVPALQRNQRNTARNNEASRVSAAVTECLANRNGDKAACNVNDNATPANDEIQEGQLQQLTLEGGPFTDVSTTASAGYTTENVTVDYQRKCNSAGSDSIAGTNRDFAVMWQNEPAVTRCIGSQ